MENKNYSGLLYRNPDLLTKIYRIYKQSGLAESGIRGTVRLADTLQELNYRKALNYEESGFSLEYDGTKLTLSDKEMFNEILFHADILKSYTVNRRLSEEDIVIDLGAYPGEFAIYAAKKCEKVYAVEPNPENMKELKRNCRLSDAENVEFISKAVSSKNGQEKISLRGGTSSVGDKGVEVQTLTLDNLIEEEIDGEPDFIKMDVEGLEVEILENANNTLSDIRPDFSIASYHLVKDEPSYIQVENILERYSYSVNTIYPPHLTTIAKPKN